jgi:hypothetical protein
MADSIETMYNKQSSKMKIRGHDGFVSHVDNEVPENQCPRKKAYTDYAESMKSILLNEKQREASA